MLLPLRYARAWLIAGLLLLVFGLVLALSTPPPSLALAIDDKLLHFAGFLGFMVWFGGVFQPRFAPLVVLGLSAYGLLIELLQSLTVTRQAEGLDLVADISGVLLGWLLCVAGLSRWCLKLESWFVSRQPGARNP
jgi:VanZ family protein